MTPAELKSLIESDTQATALANAGNDESCAARCSVIAPKQIVPTRLGDINIVSLFADPVVGESVCQTIEAVAEQNPIVKRAWLWAEPGKPGLDVGDVRVRAMLVTPTNLGGVGLTEEQAAPILAVAEQQQKFTAAQIAEAWRS